MIKQLLKKNIILAISALGLSFMVASTCNMTSQACELKAVEENTSLGENTPRSPIIEYRYKVIDGVLYRRLYNYSDEYWIGEWEVVPLVPAP